MLSFMAEAYGLQRAQHINRVRMLSIYIVRILNCERSQGQLADASR